MPKSPHQEETKKYINAAKCFLYVETTVKDFRIVSVAILFPAIFPVHYSYLDTFSFLMSLSIYSALN